MQIISRKEALAAGLVRYRTGLACKYGHTAERYALSGNCVECKHPEKAAAWSAANPEKRKAAAAAFRASAKGKATKAAYNASAKGKAAKAKWRAANSEKEKAQQAEYRAANPEKQRVRHAEYRASNLDMLRARAARYGAANPEKSAAASRNRRARAVAAGGTHTAADVEERKKLQKGKCAHCRKKLGKKYHVDHIVPLHLGGSNDKRNIQLAHDRCNMRKGARDPIEYMQRLGLLL